MKARSRAYFQRRGLRVALGEICADVFATIDEASSEMADAIEEALNVRPLLSGGTRPAVFKKKKRAKKEEALGL